MMKKVISKGVAIDPSAIDASSARLQERKDWLHGASMRFAAQHDERPQRQQFLPLVATAAALTQQGAIQDDMKDGLNLRGRMTSVVTPFATGGVVPPPNPKDRVAPKQYTVGESKPAGNLQANIADQPTNPPVPADESGLNEDSKGLLLVVAFGAALAAVLVAFS